MGKNIGKNKNKYLSGKYCQKSFDHAKQSETDVLKTSSTRVIKKKGDGTGDLIGNKVTDIITKVSKNSQQNNSEKVTNENDKKNPKRKIYIFREKTRNY